MKTVISICVYFLITYSDSVTASILSVESLISIGEDKVNVTCRDGSSEIARMEDLKADKICGGSHKNAPFQPIKSVKIDGGGGAEIECPSGNREWARTTEIRYGVLCASDGKGIFNYSLSIGGTLKDTKPNTLYYEPFSVSAKPVKLSEWFVWLHEGAGRIVIGIYSRVNNLPHQLITQSQVINLITQERYLVPADEIVLPPGDYFIGILTDSKVTLLADFDPKNPFTTGGVVKIPFSENLPPLINPLNCELLYSAPYGGAALGVPTGL